MTNLDIYVNTGTLDDELLVTGVEFELFSSGNDQLIFSAGSTEVDDGDDTPTQQELINAGIILTGSEIIVSRYFLLDASANELKESTLMGNQDTRYVMAFDFDDATASEPTLEAYDDDTLTTVTGTILGSGTPNNSFIRGITTTYATPGTNWVGSRLAGSSAGNFLELNGGNGSLTGADTLYCTLKVIIPASQTTGFGANPVFVVKYLTN